MIKKFNEFSDSSKELKEEKKKIKFYKTITKKEWESTSSDYKSVIDGVKYKMLLDPEKGTILAPVEVKEEKKKIKFYKTITKKEWEDTSSDYKSVIDGVKYKMFLDPKVGTILAPVEVKG